MTNLAFRRAVLVAGAITAALTMPAAAQDSGGTGHRTRIGLGAQIYPSYPGSDDFDIGPMINVDRASGDQPFTFEAPDDSFSLSLIEAGTFSFGPVANFEGARTAEDVGANVPKVKFSVEAGGFAAINLSDNFRLRGEVRRGITGHKGWIGTAGADYVMRDGDDWLFSIGPRVTWSNSRYQDAWFGVTPQAALTSGLPVYNPGSGIQSYGATASLLFQLSEQIGVSTFAKYDRLTGDAARSPLVLQYGSRDQLSAGFGLSYTF